MTRHPPRAHLGISAIPVGKGAFARLFQGGALPTVHLQPTRRGSGTATAGSRPSLRVGAGILAIAAALPTFAQAPPNPPPPPVVPPATPAPAAPVAPPAAEPPTGPLVIPPSGTEREPLALERFREERDGIVTVFFQVGRENVKLIVPLIQKFLTPKGEIVENEAARVLMIRDVKENIDRVVTVLRLIDSPEPQILIEATIVEVSSDFNLQLGVEGITTTPTPRASTLRPIPEMSVYERAPSSTSLFREYSARFQPSEFIRSLQPGATPYQGAAIGFGSVNNFMTFNGIVRLLSDKGYAKVLSRPRIMVKNGKPAEIFAGEKTPYLNANLLGNPPVIAGKFEWLETGITLKITPRLVTQDVVDVDLKPSVKTIIGNVAINTGAATSYIPAYIERRADTMVSVPDGAEIVIGGLQRFEKNTEATGVPLLMDIPLLGYLFKRHEEKEVATNIVIVVRPTVIRDVRSMSALVPPDVEMPEPMPPK